MLLGYIRQYQHKHNFISIRCFMSVSCNYTAMPKVDSKNMKRIESEHTTMEKHQFTKEGSRREERENKTTKQPQNSKMALVSP